MLKHKLLKQLSEQIQQLEQDLQRVNTQTALINEARFDPQLFAFAPTDKRAPLTRYLDEIQRHFHQLCELVDNNNLTLVSYLADKIVAQITALTREIATLDLRSTPKVDKNVTQAELRQQYLGYLKRLKNMQTQYEKQLNQATSFTEKQTIEKALAALEGRLYRCQTALKKLE